eukprot:UN06945
MITLTVLFGLVYIVYHGYLSLYPIGTLQSLQSLQSLSRLSPKFGRPKEIDSTHNTSIDSRYNRIFVKRKDEKQQYEYGRLWQYIMSNIYLNISMAKTVHIHDKMSVNLAMNLWYYKLSRKMVILFGDLVWRRVHNYFGINNQMLGNLEHNFQRLDL